MSNSSRPNPQAPAGSLILVVEDDKFLRAVFSQKLSNEGFRVEEAVDGEEALEKINQLKPQLVLLDIVLPKIDGFTVLERMKAERATAKIPVLILSNLGQEEDIQKGMKLGAEDYLVKAYFTPSEIAAKVRKILYSA